MDAALKETEYDVLLVGTGMVEAILAGALARVGQKVLHLDQNDYYGSNYASFPLAQFLRWTRNEAVASRAFGDDDSDVATSKTTNTPRSTLPGDSTLRALPMESCAACHLLAEGFSDAATEQELLRQSAAFSMDVNPKLLLSSESLVETLISSGVGRYLEFAAIERTYVHLASATAASTHGDAVWQVPCSKKDVFQSKLLRMVEKRQLMKFLQFVADYGETHILHADVRTKNERSLALGRALQRPQNKASQAAARIADFLDGPFQDLLETYFHLSPKLQQVVIYCVGLASFPFSQQLSARAGLAAVYRYVASIGRFTGTAFLAPLYGISELAQSFCRLAAVYGAVYVLRAPVDAFLLDSDAKKLRGVRCSDGDTLRARHVVVNGSYRRSVQLSGDATYGQVLRGVFVLRRSLRAEVGRLMLVLPPGDEELENPAAVQVVQLDAGAYACPSGLFLLQVSMTLPSAWRGQDDKQLAFLERVLGLLLRSAEAESRAKTPGDVGKAEAQREEQQEEQTTGDWSHVVAWRALFCVDQLAATPAPGPPATVEKAELPSNVTVCEAESSATAACALELHLESATTQARALFQQLCPGEPFLPKSASAEQAEQEEQAGEEDAVLRAAQKLAEKAELGQDKRSSVDEVGDEDVEA